MHLDVLTLAVVMVFATTLTGLMFIVSWRQNPDARALGWWGLSYLLAASCVVLIFARGRIPDVLSIEVAHALLAIAAGVGWNAARLFDGRRPLLIAGIAGSIVWLIACRFDAFMASLPLRVALSSLTLAAYTALTACEIWKGRTEPLVARWAAIAFLGVHTVVILARIAVAQSMVLPDGTANPGATWTAIILFEGLFHAVGLALSLVMMARERSELAFRRAAETDPLTGVMNRGAFMRAGERLLARTGAARRPVAALLLDLDHFKRINDTHGHQGGDRALIEFCRVAGACLRPGDLFGRLGGEEFACLLPDVAVTAAAEIAERIRAEFAQGRIEGAVGPIAATVSIGAAITVGPAASLDALLGCADGALYRAKSRGRNVVEWDRPPLAVSKGAKSQAWAPTRALAAADA
jgi:diguanylate cyclase (GGDEF)-like protein